MYARKWFLNLFIAVIIPKRTRKTLIIIENVHKSFVIKNGYYIEMLIERRQL